MLKIEVQKNPDNEGQLATNTVVDGPFSDIIVELAAANTAVIARYTDSDELKAATVQSIGQMMFQMFGLIKETSDFKPLEKGDEIND